MSYKTGVTTCRSTIDGIPLGEKLSTLSTEDFEQIDDNNTNNLNTITKSFLRAISTTCKAMGHTEQAAKDARRCCFAMLDFFGLNSLFMSTAPDDECSFRVSFYCKPHSWVSSGGIFQIGIIRLFQNLALTTYSKVEYSVISKVEFFFLYVESNIYCLFSARITKHKMFRRGLPC